MWQRFQYLTCCVSIAQEQVDDLHNMIERARTIEHDTFIKRCDWAPLARQLGYAVGSEPGLHLKDDWHVSYHLSVFQGKPCYYLRHSAIEYIFVSPT